MAGKIHSDLIEWAVRWLRRNGFVVMATEISCLGVREQPDAIGFRSTCSVVLEAKASRADFLADRRKPERAPNANGLGVYRFYICPEGLIQPDELPPGWGLLYVADRKIVEVLRPQGNLWPPYGSGGDTWATFQHRPNIEAERTVLYSIALRQSKGGTSQSKAA
ncbi:hypothetical protein [Burkholderia gladioli]|uniref:hypothetical protein n=1 Tax=Burkholderia gladioli TaxID=28095 RepID=UPI00163E980D|nr:hypothetical protein [Burkholderia gladioli]